MNRLVREIEGQSLFEILIAIGIAALIIGSATTAIVISLTSERNNVATQKAYALAEEMLNNVNSYSEANWSTLFNQPDKTSDGEYHLEIVSTSTDSSVLGIATGTDSVSFTFTATSTEENVTYTTWFSVEDMDRGSSQELLPSGGGTKDPSTQKITAHISWVSGGDTREVDLVQMISNIRSFTARSINWSGTSGSTSTVTQFGADYFYKTTGIFVSSQAISLSEIEYVPDETPPTVLTFSPLDDATDVAVGTNLVITFSEIVGIGTGNVTIKKTADDSTVEAIAVTSGQVTGSGSDTITINPTSDFGSMTGYYIQIDATAFQDASTNAYAGIADKTTWNFTSVSTYLAATYNAAGHNAGSGTSFTVPLSGVSSGALVVLTVGGYLDGNACYVMQSGGWTAYEYSIGTNGCGLVYYQKFAGAPVNPSLLHISMEQYSFSWVAFTNVSSVEWATTGGTSAANDPPNKTATKAVTSQDVWIAASGGRNGSGHLTPSGYTLGGEHGGNSGTHSGVYYKVGNGSASENPGATYGSGGQFWAAGTVAAFGTEQ